MAYITFEGIEYPTREIIVTINGDKYQYTVAPIELEYALMDDEGDYLEYKNDETKTIDDGIYYYCTSDEWVMDDETLGEYLSEE